MNVPINPAAEVFIYEDFVSDKELLVLHEIFDTEKDKFLLVSDSVNVLGFGQDNFPKSYFFDSPNKVSEKLPKYLEFIEMYCERLNSAINANTEKDTTLSVLWFVEKFNGGFPPHDDNEPDAIYEYDMTCVLYLNDCIDGGEISFPEYGYTYTPKAGSLICFPAKYVHEVSPVSSIRRAMPSWFTQDKAYAFSSYLK